MGKRRGFVAGQAAIAIVLMALGARGAAAFDTMLARLAADHARALGVPVVMANMCGDHMTAGLVTRFPGLSSIADSAGEFRARLDGEEGVIAADILLARDRIGKGQVRVDRVAVAAPVALARDVAGVGELDHDPVRGALGDPDTLADLAQPDAWITSNAHKHLRVVGQERPTACGGLGHRNLVYHL